MAGERIFECPACGAKLSTDGTQIQIKCEYCGNTVVVPDSLRVKPAAPAQTPPGKEQLVEAFVQLASAAQAIEAERMAERQAQGQPAAPPPRRPRRRGCGCLLPLLALIVLAVMASGQIPNSVVPPQLRELLGIAVRPSKQEVIDRPLQGTLPRDVRYAGLDFKVNAANVTNRDPNSSAQAPRYRTDQAYAELDLSITNLSTTDSVYLEPTAVRLELADGKTYPASRGWSESFQKQATSDVRLVFAVPYAAALKGAKLILQEGGKQPATLPLDGPAPVAQYPIALAAGEHATAGQVNYTVLSALLDLDANGKRADAGKRFLLLKMRVENTSDFRGGMALGADYFRLLVDGAPLAPAAAPGELVKAKSAVEGDVVFVVPETAVQAILQVGEVGKEQPATIPLNLKGGA